MDIKPTNREVRISNRRRIINTLFRQGPMTIQALTHRLHLSHGTVSNIIKELSGRGLVARGDTLTSSGGRPPAPVTIVFDARCAIGISVSTHHVRILQLNLGPHIVTSERHALRISDTPAYWEQVSALLEDFIRRNGIDESVLVGVGLSIQSPVETGKGIVKITAAGYWNSEIMAGAFKRPVTINNDAKAAGYAQVWGGEYPADLVFLYLDAGVGGAIIIDRHIWDRGGKNAEFGHVVVNEDGPLCSCGQHGCLGSYCSSWTIRKLSGVELDVFFAELDAGNKAYGTIWEEYLHYLALGISNIHTIFDTDMVVGGEMSQYLKQWEQALTGRLGALNPFGESRQYLHIGEYGENDSAMGAALLHIDAFLNR